MKDQDKTKEQLIRDLQEARRRIGELEHFKDRLDASLELFENVGENPGTFGCWQLDLRTFRLKITELDGKTPRFSGSDPECTCYIHPDDLKLLKGILHSGETRDLFDFTHRLVTPAGDTLTLAVSALLWRSPGGETELAGVFRDFSPIQVLMQNLDVPGCLRTIFLAGCETGARQFKTLRNEWRRADEAMCLAITPILLDDISNEHKQRCVQALGVALEFDHCLRAAALSAAEQQAFGYVGNRVEEASSLFMIAPVFTKDCSFKYISVNDATCRFFELPKSKILGRTDRDILGEESDAQLEELDVKSGGLRILRQEHTKRTAARIVPFTQMMFPVTPVTRINEESMTYYWGLILVEEELGSSKLSEEMIKAALSPAMREVMSLVLKAAQEDCIVLLTGDTGSGKDHIARLIHDHSPRASAPFVNINLGGLSPELADSELFGHEQGAFTGAYRRKRGLLELAEGGTLLLNEVGDLSLPLQVKLLTFLDTRQFIRVGGEQMITVNARLIAATRLDLEREVAEGRFRQDLFYRINVMHIRVPSLRERSEDIPALTREILDMLKEERRSVHPLRVTPDQMLKLRGYHWPGGIRQLRNVLETALIQGDGRELALEAALPNTFAKAKGDGSTQDAGGNRWMLPVTFREDSSDDDLLKEALRSLIDEALRRSNGNKTQAARLLGVTLPQLKSKLQTLGITGSK
jgi:DNA-binding NtrC family response regulator/PAS domain-containing protein